MIYLESQPSPELAGVIRSLWYVCAPNVQHERERVFPNGCAQVVISLAADNLTECDESLGACRPMSSAILVGARSRYEVIHMRDLKELVGIVFRPGGLGPWLRDRADAVFEKSLALDAVLSVEPLRDRLRSASTPACKLQTLNGLLVEHLNGRKAKRKPMLEASLLSLRRNGVRQTAQSLGVSERRLHQVFREDAGLSPKLWSRIVRFQCAVKSLHRGEEIRWDRLALDCGYYDQSHFANSFRAFSGIDPSTYSRLRGPWQNHVIHT